MSTRRSMFYLYAHNATGVATQVHVFRDGFSSSVSIEAARAVEWTPRLETAVVALDLIAEDFSAFDSTVMFAIARKLRAMERAQAFQQRFGHVLWGWAP